jgi:hypothetical protein
MQWVHVDDVARAFMLAADREVAVGRAYTLGDDPPMTLLEYLETLARVAGKPLHPVLFEDGLRETFEWYGEQRPEPDGSPGRTGSWPGRERRGRRSVRRVRSLRSVRRRRPRASYADAANALTLST